MLGPILVVLYMPPLDEIFSRHSVGHHAFSDDTQLQRSCTRDLVQSTVREMEECVSEVKSWMTDKLQLNDGEKQTNPPNTQKNGGNVRYFEACIYLQIQCQPRCA